MTASKACKYLQDHHCQIETQKDDIDCLMCLHGQMIIYQQHVLDLIEPAPVPLATARQLMHTEKTLAKVNDAFETLMIDMHPVIADRREAYTTRLNVNPLVT